MILPIQGCRRRESHAPALPLSTYHAGADELTIFLFFPLAPPEQSKDSFRREGAPRFFFSDIGCPDSGVFVETRLLSARFFLSRIQVIEPSPILLSLLFF